LVLRYLRVAQRLVAWLARRSGVGVEDAADAKQEAVSFWVRQAIAAYDVCRSAAAGCRFRTLLHRVVIARFRNYARALKRRQAHHAPGVAPEQCAAAHREPPPVFGRQEGSDPAQTVEWRELRALLEGAVGALPAAWQRLWDWVSAGRSLRRWALRHDLAYKSVQRTWHEVVRAVMGRVRGDDASPPT
jgi:DNA-directed RNA polymerase specialized sigma24 family protein